MMGYTIIDGYTDTPRWLSLSALLLLGACSAAPEQGVSHEGDTHEIDTHEIDTAAAETAETDSTVQAPEAPVRQVAELELDSGASLVFLQDLGSERIAVGESAPVEIRSPAGSLIDEQGASPLEVFLALAPGDAAVPASLRVDHELGRGTPAFDSNELAVAAPALEAQAANLNIFEYADCSLTSDGAWFDGAWSNLGSPWHWYTYKTGRTQPLATPISPAASNWRGHVCLKTNVNPHFPYTVRFLREFPGTTLLDIWRTRVSPGIRVRLWLFDWPAARGAVEASGGNFVGVDVGMGVFIY